MKPCKFDKKALFEDLDSELKKAAKKNKKKHKKDKSDKDPFGFDISLKKSQKDKKKNKDDKNKEKKHKKYKPTKLEDSSVDIKLGKGKFSKKILKSIHSKEVKEGFKRGKTLIEEKKFWSAD